ncbi:MULTISPECIES: response regulator [unclassified Polaribacter]|uniref:response regulator n=1 Tax=unclassified Polaribacter TaxID=196858 RepID=UPI001678322E|nr:MULTISPECIES: response regulator [unclassified Polaribacter]
MKSTVNNLLIVEDNPFISESIADGIKDYVGVRNLKLAVSLQEAISFLNDVQFELIILDLNLQDGNGIELLKWIKERQYKTKVLVFSISTAFEKKCLQLGAFAFFDKAKDFDKLIDTIKNP